MSEQNQELENEEELAAKAEEERQALEAQQKEEGLSDVEREQQTHGWTTKEQWVEDGHDEKEWRTAAHFKLVSESHRLRNENKHYREEVAGFDGRLKSQEKLIRLGFETQITDLEVKRDDANADALVDKGKDYQKQIDVLKEQSRTEETTSDATDPVIVEWNKNNLWIDNPGSKSLFAGKLYNRGKEDGLSSEEILEMVEKEVEKEYPGTIAGGKPREKTKVLNARRGDPSTTTSGKTQSGKKTGLTMSDLSADDKDVRKNSNYMTNLSDEKFLKLVEKTRAAEAAENE